MNSVVLRVNMAITLDGRVMLPNGRWHGLTSSEDRDLMDEYRLEADALIIGRNSIVRDNPIIIPEKAQNSAADPPLPVMICRNSLPPPDRHFFTQKNKRPLLFISENLARDSSDLRACSEIKILKDDELHPASILKQLAKRGIRRVLLEGGPTLNYAFFRDDLVDDLCLTIVPYIIGGKGLPAFVAGETPFADFNLAKWSLERTKINGSELFLHYKRTNKKKS